MSENQERKTWIMYKVADPGVIFNICPWYNSTIVDNGTYKGTFTNTYGTWYAECNNCWSGDAENLWNANTKSQWGTNNHSGSDVFINTLTFPTNVKIKPSKFKVIKYAKTNYNFVIEGLNVNSGMWEPLCSHRGPKDGDGQYTYAADIPRIEIILDAKPNGYYSGFRIKSTCDKMSAWAVFYWELACIEGKILVS